MADSMPARSVPDDLVAEIRQGLLGGMQQAVGLVAGLHQLAEPPIVLGVRFGVADHPLDLVLRQAARGLDDDLLLAPGGLVSRRHVQDAVGIDVERDLDLRHAARRRRNFAQIEAPQRLVVARPLPLALQHVDGHGRLVVVRGREHLGCLGRNGRVLLDELAS